MTATDTTREAVERLARVQEGFAWPADVPIPSGTVTQVTVAALRALLAEREAALKARDTAIMETGHIGRKLGATQADLAAARAEAQRLRRGWLKSIQVEQACMATGRPCGTKGQCQCADDMALLMDEDDAQAALEGRADG